MKRIVLTGAAVAALFTVGIPAGAVAAAKSHTTTRSHTKAVHVRETCTLRLTTVAPSGSGAVIAGAGNGTNFGATRCPGAGTGVARQVFSIAASGTMSGKLQQWSADGSMFGTFTLTQASLNAPPTATSFGKASYSGTVTLHAATGALKGTSAKGTLACDTPDSVHYTCTEHLIVSVPVLDTTTKTSKGSKAS